MHLVYLIDNQTSANQEVAKSIDRNREMVSARLDEGLSPIAQRLDKIENESQRSSASIDSLASEVSRLVARFSANSSSSIRSNFNDAEPHTGFEGAVWSCDTIPGIESAFASEDDTIQLAAQFTCLFCKTILHTVDWCVLGTHLVKSHNFGKCNLSVSYKFKTGFKKHLVDFHNLRSTSVDDDFLELHQCKAAKVSFDRGPESKVQFYVQFEENVETIGIYHAQARALLKSCLETASSGDRERLLYLERDVACLQEEIFVNGHEIDLGDIYPAISSPLNVSKRLGVSKWYCGKKTYTRMALTNGCWSWQGHVDQWLFEVLMLSWTTRLILRYKIPLEPFPTPELGIWLCLVADHWSKDETAKSNHSSGVDKAVQSVEVSGGAIDSRDSELLARSSYLLNLPKEDDGLVYQDI